MLRELAKITPWFAQINCVALTLVKSQGKWMNYLLSTQLESIFSRDQNL